MNQDIRVDLTGVADLDPATGTMVKIAKPKWKMPGEESVIEAGLQGYGSLGLPRSGVVKDFLDFKSRPALRVTTTGTMKYATVKPSKAFTIALGPSASAGAMMMLGLSGGVYGSNPPELGLFGSFNFSVITNVSASLVGQVMILFGKPADVLAGESHTLGVEIGGKLVTGGGFLVFNEKVPASELIGFGFQLGIGASLLPLDFVITKSNTAIKPVFRF